VAKPKLQKPLS